MSHTPVILVAEDQRDILELIVMLLQSNLKPQIYEAGSLKEALDTLKSKQDINCVLSDYDLSDGYSIDIYNYLKENRPDVPFILCTGTPLRATDFTEKHTLNAVIAKPFRSEELLTALNNALGYQRVQLKNKDGKQKFHPVKLQILLKIGMINFDLYIKLSEDRYVKVIRSGEGFSKEDFEKYTQKDIHYLYIESRSLSDFIDSYAADLFQLSQARKMGTTEVLDIASEAHGMLHHLFQGLGASSDVEKLAQACTAMAITNISNEPKLKPYVEKLTFKKDEFLSIHSVILAQVCCLLASLLGLETEMIGYKLAYASMVHDLTLPGTSVAQLDLAFNTAVPTGQTESHKEKIRDHIQDTIKMIRQLKTAPAGVLEIVRYHHEGPKGSGYPDQLDALTFGVLPALFIIGHEITNYIWLVESNADIKSFIESRSEFYTNGVFRKIYDSIVNS